MQKFDWTKVYGGNSADASWAIDVSSDGSIYAFGWTYSEFDGQSLSGNTDAFLIKYTKEGNRAWTKFIGGNKAEGGYDIEVTSNGSIVVVGYTTGNLDDQINRNTVSAFVTSYNASGNKEWTRLNDNYSHGHSITSDKNGYIYYGGYKNSGAGDSFVAKLDSSGNKQWETTFNGSGTEYLQGIAIDKHTNDVYITGYTHSSYFYGNASLGNWDNYISKINSDGTIDWVKRFGTSGQDTTRAIETGSDGSLYVAGNSLAYGGSITKFDKNGTIIWTKYIGETVSGITVNDDASSIFITGWTLNSFEGSPTAGYSDAFIAEFKSDGTKVWSKLLGGASNDYGYGISLDQDKNIVITGITHGELAGQTHYGIGDGFLNKLFIDNGEATFSITGTAELGKTLIINQSTPDPDGTGNLTYKWQILDSNNWVNVGKNSSTYTITSNDINKPIKAVVSYKDNEGFDESVLATSNIKYEDNGESTFRINNDFDLVSGGTAEVGNTLTIEEFKEDPDGSGTLSYSWQSSSDGINWNQIAKTPRYKLTATEEGKKFRAVVSYKDKQGFDEVVTTELVNIKTTDDGDAIFGLIETKNNTSVKKSDKIAYGETLKIGNIGSDIDYGHNLQTEKYIWQISSDGSTWKEVGKESTYKITKSDEGKSIRALVSYTDRQGFDEVVPTHTVDIRTDDGDASYSLRNN